MLSLICNGEKSGEGRLLKWGSLSYHPANSSMGKPWDSPQHSLWKQMAQGPELLYCQSLRFRSLAPCERNPELTLRATAAHFCFGHDNYNNTFIHPACFRLC